MSQRLRHLLLLVTHVCAALLAVQAPLLIAFTSEGVPTKALSAVLSVAGVTLLFCNALLFGGAAPGVPTAGPEGTPGAPTLPPTQGA